MTDQPGFRRGNVPEYTRLIQLAAVRLQFAAATADDDNLREALDAEATSISELLGSVGSDLQLGNALAGSDHWQQLANDIREVGNHLANAAQEVGHAVDAAANVVHDAVGGIVDAVTHAFGGIDITTLETLQTVGFVEQVAAGASAEDLFAAKEDLVAAYAIREQGLRLQRGLGG